MEVKGTRGNGETVILTANEVESAQGSSEPTDLVIVSHIELTEEQGETVASGGKLKVYQCWVPFGHDLHVTQYRYSVPVDIST